MMWSAGAGRQPREGGGRAGGERVGVVRVERRVLRGPDVRGGTGEALRIPAGEDDLGAFGAGAASRLEPDTGAAAEDDDALAEQGRLAHGGRAVGDGGHGCSVR